MSIQNNTKTLRIKSINGDTSFQNVILNVDSYIRLLFWGGARRSDHNNTFYAAAVNVKRDYTDGKVEVIEITGGGQFIVNKINSYSRNSIQSIDFFTHGGETSLYFKVDSDGNRQDLYINDSDEQKHGTLEFLDIIFGKNDDENENGADIGEIDYSVFTNTAKIEIHGCNTGSITDENKGINFASVLSEYLYNAGKNKSVVISHVDSANPDQHTTLRGSDYRHGGRRVYHNGKELFFTREEGRIKASEINKHFN